MTNLPTLYLVAISVQFATSMTSTALFTVMMDKSELETAGTDYTVQTSVIYLGGIVPAAISGVIAEVIGYQGVFAISITLFLVSIALIARTFDDTRSTQRLPRYPLC